MVLGGQDDLAKTGGLQSLHPLEGIQVGGVKKRWIFQPTAPFRIGKGIDAKMDEGAQLQALPGLLAWAGSDLGGFAQDICWLIGGKDGDDPGWRGYDRLLRAGIEVAPTGASSIEKLFARKHKPVATAIQVHLIIPDRTFCLGAAYAA